jgi:hypothetical protein
MLIFNNRPANPASSFDASRSNAEFFRSVAGDVNTCAILLIGGSDFASWTVRTQQAALRYDRRPSDYSHAALICAWDRADPEQSWGFELDPIRVPAAKQLPEYMGVTPFRLADYSDQRAYPNLALSSATLARHVARVRDFAGERAASAAESAAASRRCVRRDGV